MPEDPSAEPAHGATDTAADAAIPVADTAKAVAPTKSSGGRGRPAGHWPPDLTPTLVAWLQTHPHIHSLDKAVQVI